MLAYKAKKNSVNALMNETRSKFYNDFVQDNSGNQRSLFSAVFHKGPVLAPCFFLSMHSSSVHDC